MLAATLIAVFLVPVQYYVIETLVEGRKGSAPDAGATPKPGPGPIAGTAPEFAE
jgi:hypothetical protein